MYQQQNGQQKFGDYVKYTPDKETFNMADTEPTTKETYAALAGYSSQKKSFTTESFAWRIWNIDEENDKLTIIADATTTDTILLYGYTRI